MYILIGVVFIKLVVIIFTFLLADCNKDNKYMKPLYFISGVGTFILAITVLIASITIQ